jgi:hypothetical protein
MYSSAHDGALEIYIHRAVIVSCLELSLATVAKSDDAEERMSRFVAAYISDLTAFPRTPADRIGIWLRRCHTGLIGFRIGIRKVNARLPRPMMLPNWAPTHPQNSSTR